MKQYIARKLMLVFDKFVEGFIFGLGLFGFYSLGVWAGWFQ